MRFWHILMLAVFGLSCLVNEAQAWPRKRESTAYTSYYLAPYYPPGPVYQSYYFPPPAVPQYIPGNYLAPPIFPSNEYPYQFNTFDVPLTNTGIPRYWHGLTAPAINEFDSARWR
jgi:hypothetical protein